MVDDVELRKKQDLAAQREIFKSLMSAWNLLGGGDVSIEFCFLKSGDWGILSAKRLGDSEEEINSKRSIENNKGDVKDKSYFG